ncbi:hypothetical protein T492DRAFT_881677, partial [Pavlovales sp. CCMP2436]
MAGDGARNTAREKRLEADLEATAAREARREAGLDTLASVALNEHVLSSMREYVTATHEVRIRGTEALALLLATEPLSHPSEFVNDVFVRNLCAVVSHPSGTAFRFNGHEALCAWYAAEYEPLKVADESARVPISHNQNAYTYLGRSVSTAYKNNIAMHFDKHVKRFVEIWVFGGDRSRCAELFPDGTSRSCFKRLINATVHSLLTNDTSRDYCELDRLFAAAKASTGAVIVSFREQLVLDQGADLAPSLDEYAAAFVFPTPREGATAGAQNHYATSRGVHALDYLRGMMHMDELAWEYGARKLVVCPKCTSNIPTYATIDTVTALSHF